MHRFGLLLQLCFFLGAGNIYVRLLWTGRVGTAWEGLLIAVERWARRDTNFNSLFDRLSLRVWQLGLLEVRFLFVFRLVVSAYKTVLCGTLMSSCWVVEHDVLLRHLDRVLLHAIVRLNNHLGFLLSLRRFTLSFLLPTIRLVWRLLGSFLATVLALHSYWLDIRLLIHLFVRFIWLLRLWQHRFNQRLICVVHGLNPYLALIVDWNFVASEIPLRPGSPSRTLSLLRSLPLPLFLLLRRLHLLCFVGRVDLALFILELFFEILTD